MKQYLLDFLNQNTGNTFAWNKLPIRITVEIKNQLVKMIQLGIIPVYVQPFEGRIHNDIINNTNSDDLQLYKQLDCWKDYYFPCISFFIPSKYAYRFEDRLELNHKSSYYYTFVTKPFPPDNSYYKSRYKEKGERLVNINIFTEKYPSKKFISVKNNSRGFYPCSFNISLPNSASYPSSDSIFLPFIKKSDHFFFSDKLKKIISTDYVYYDIFDTERNNSLFDTLIKSYEEIVDLSEDKFEYKFENPIENPIENTKVTIDNDFVQFKNKID